MSHRNVAHSCTGMQMRQNCELSERNCEEKQRHQRQTEGAPWIPYCRHAHN